MTSLTQKLASARAHHQKEAAPDGGVRRYRQSQQANKDEKIVK